MLILLTIFGGLILYYGIIFTIESRSQFLDNMGDRTADWDKWKQLDNIAVWCLCIGGVMLMLGLSLLFNW